jgi:hypothetical protein
MLFVFFIDYVNPVSINVPAKAFTSPTDDRSIRVSRLWVFVV